MAQTTLDPAALIRKQLEDADPDLLRELLQEVVEAIMSTEVDSVAGAAYVQRSPDRSNRRNEYRGRAGTLASAPSTFGSPSSAAGRTSRPGS